MDREKDPIYELDGKISFEKAIPFGLQHVLAMFVANIAPILIVAGAVKLSTEETGALVQAAMIIAGIGSLFQLYPLGPLGSGLPIIMGISFTFVSTFCVIGAKYGYGAVLGAALVGGLLEGLIGMGAKYWRRFIPPLRYWSQLFWRRLWQSSFRGTQIPHRRDHYPSQLSYLQYQGQTFL